MRTTYTTSILAPADEGRSVPISGLAAVSVGLGLAALGTILQYSDLDLRWERIFFDANSGGWPWKEHWLTESVIHKGGARFVALFGAILLLGIAGTFVNKEWRRWRSPLLCLILSMASGPVLVSWIKDATHIYTPWDLAVFGGAQPHVRLFDAAPEGAPIGHAFPSGHASGGFAFVSLYFWFEWIRPELAKAGLAFGLILGLAFGIAQQARGAHLLSHDLFAFAVCWTAAWAWHVFFIWRANRQSI